MHRTVDALRHDAPRYEAPRRESLADAPPGIDAAPSPTFAGCRSFQLTRDAVEHYEGRFECWDVATETVRAGPLGRHRPRAGARRRHPGHARRHRTRGHSLDPPDSAPTETGSGTGRAVSRKSPRDALRDEPYCAAKRHGSSTTPPRNGWRRCWRTPPTPSTWRRSATGSSSAPRRPSCSPASATASGAAEWTRRSSRYIRKTCNWRFRERTAERIKRQGLSRLRSRRRVVGRHRDRHLVVGIPKTISVCDTEIREAWRKRSA